MLNVYLKCAPKPVIAHRLFESSDSVSDANPTGERGFVLRIQGRESRKVVKRIKLKKEKCVFRAASSSLF